MITINKIISCLHVYSRKYKSFRGKNLKKRRRCDRKEKSKVFRSIE